MHTGARTMNDKIERKFTEEECVANGGHFWKYYNINEGVDENFERNGIVINVYYPDGTPRMRGCPLCGRREKEIHFWQKKYPEDME